MAKSLADEAIALLIELAEQGEIDPWDVQVIDVIDRFLTQLAPTANTRDLSESGQAFLYASMLVYLKAMALAHAEEAEEELEEFVGDFFENDALDIANIPLEQVLLPRPVARISRTRPVTLRELIEQLQILEEAVQRQEQAAPKHPTLKPTRQSRSERISTISQLSHPENLLETVALLEPLLARAWEHSPIASFTTMLSLLQESHPDHASTASLMWALLHLASRAKVFLHQEEFYQDLSLLPIAPASSEAESA
jgi:segregation and condensation protein A